MEESALLCPEYIVSVLHSKILQLCKCYNSKLYHKV